MSAVGVVGLVPMCNNNLVSLLLGVNHKRRNKKVMRIKGIREIRERKE